jgi:hypothetical protein
MPDLLHRAVRETVALRGASAIPAHSRDADGQQVRRGPMNVTSDITSSSRIGSIGGFVTCANNCLK